MQDNQSRNFIIPKITDYIVSQGKLLTSYEYNNLSFAESFNSSFNLDGYLKTCMKNITSYNLTLDKSYLKETT